MWYRGGFKNGQGFKQMILVLNNMPVINDEINIEENISMRTKSDYLIISHRKKCKDLIEISPLSPEDIIDILISLHIVLEVGINAFFRQITLNAIKKTIGTLDVVKNIDQISFIDKTTLFIYNSTFDFSGKNDQASEYHKIIGMLKDFSGIRNSLLHGHAIMTVSNGVDVQHSKLKEQINLKYLDEQLKKFRFILEGLSFYFDCLVSSWTSSGKEDLKKEYLDISFLPHFRV